MPTISTIFYSIDAGDWGIIDEFPYEQIFSRWWYFQSAESRGHLESVNPGSRIKCKMSVQGPEVTALSGGNKYHYSISDPISVSRWGPENNLIKQLSANSERQNNNWLWSDLQAQEMLCPISTVAERPNSGRMVGEHHRGEESWRVLRSPPSHSTSAPSWGSNLWNSAV